MALNVRPELAEALGVFLIVGLGGMAILGGAAALAAALAFAFAVTVLVYAFGHLSGAHFNPAVTLAFAATGHFPWRRVPGYLAAQLVGATLAGLLLLALFGDAAPAATRLGAGVGPLEGFAVEAVATFLLALVIIAVATDPRSAPGLAGLAIGLAVGVGAIAAGPLTGGSMNPARSLGPAVAAGRWEDLWLYLAAPTAGAVAAMLAYEALRPGARPQPEERTLGTAGPFRLPRGP